MPRHAARRCITKVICDSFRLADTQFIPPSILSKHGETSNVHTVIELRNLTKHYGAKIAVDDLSLDIQTGKVTGFLGPNGAGKSTTMRMIVGLDRPTAGHALIDQKHYAALHHPLRQVGALLDAGAIQRGRSARAHLTALATSNRIHSRRVTEVLGIVGLEEVSGKRVGGFSLGMRQRLGIAAALLGDPPVLLMDEPVNGLDPDGVRWIRDLMRSLAAEGRTVLVSSHLMSEMQETADHLIVLAGGRLIVDAPIGEVIGAGSRDAVRVRSPRATELARHLASAGFVVREQEGHGLLVAGGTPAEIGDIAHRTDIPVHELSARPASLEDAYLELTGGLSEHVARDEVADATVHRAKPRKVRADR